MCITHRCNPGSRSAVNLYEVYNYMCSMAMYKYFKIMNKSKCNPSSSLTENSSREEQDTEKDTEKGMIIGIFI